MCDLAQIARNRPQMAGGGGYTMSTPPFAKARRRNRQSIASSRWETGRTYNVSPQHISPAALRPVVPVESPQEMALGTHKTPGWQSEGKVRLGKSCWPKRQTDGGGWGKISGTTWATPCVQFAAYLAVAVAAALLFLADASIYAVKWPKAVVPFGQMGH